ncbi:HNH endonuclease domain-containing protein [Flaviaesturariibacter amylovorans]|uniref:HNH endonuclease domain-containing protein n=2 Tax=Flaviaesturariibacter amylovorans TaxID=1084520 RepID=A0ABP8HHM0_9BACT
MLVFKDTTNSYKFYWLRAILQLTRNTRASAFTWEELTQEMFAQVWYPLTYYKLSFGKKDGFIKIAEQLPAHLKINNAPGAPSVIRQVETLLSAQEKERFYAAVLSLTNYVPFRFLRPFFQEEIAKVKDHDVNRAIAACASRAARGSSHLAPYHFTSAGIVLHSEWRDYFLENLGLLDAFINWHLTRFLQRNNPNIIGISQKLFKPEKRNLERSRKAWTLFRTESESCACIYSNAPLPANFSLDHFVPWSFVVHDLNWNLASVGKEVNSAKNDALPAEVYLGEFAELQHQFYRFTRQARPDDLILEDYALLFNDDLNEIDTMPAELFKGRLCDSIKPMIQIAQNAGFRSGWTYA